VVTKSRSEKRASWVPDRKEIIWIDCNPQAGQEMRDIHPFLVLSPRAFNAKTSLVIGLPMTTAAYNADNPFAVPMGKVKRGGKAGKTSYVLCHQPKSFDWRMRKARIHPLKKSPGNAFLEVCDRLNQIIQLS
jgi:mRNA interferase MazF